MSTATKAPAKSESPTHSSASARTHSQAKSPAATVPGGLAFVQQSAGNLAIQQLLNAGAIKAKLTISQPNDPDEQEADRVADRIMRMEDPGLIGSSSTVIHRKCAACDAGGAPCLNCAEEDKVQRKESAEGTSQASTSAHSLIAGLRGGGEPLSPSVRAFFEPRFGRNLSDVRVHTGGDAANSAHAIQARAYTTGNNIVFARDQYSPESADGRRLLAHELVHVIHQSRMGSYALHLQKFPSTEELGSMACSAVGTVAESEQRNRALIETAWHAGGTLVERGISSAHGVWNEVRGSAPARSVMGTMASGVDWITSTAGVARDRIMEDETVQAAMGYGGRAWTEVTETASAAVGGVTSGMASARRWVSERSAILLPLLGPLAPVIPIMNGLRKIYDNQEEIFQGIHDALGELIGEIPTRLRSYIDQVQAQFQALSVARHLEGIWRYLGPALEHLRGHWWQELKNLGWSLLWPWSTVRRDVGSIWTLEGQLLEHLRRCEISEAIDKAIEIVQKVNAILGSLFGWFFLASVLIGAIIGAFFGGAGAVPGAVAGAMFAGTVGEALLGMLIGTEIANIGKATLDLAVGVSGDRQESAYQRIANSVLTLAITDALLILGELAMKFAQAVWSGARSFFGRGRGVEVEGATNRSVRSGSETPVLEEPLSQGRATVAEDGLIRICRSPCRLCEEILSGSNMDPARAANFRERLVILQEAIERLRQAGASEAEIHARYGDSITSLSDEIIAADAGIRGSGGPGRGAPEETGSVFDTADQHDPYARVEPAQTGTAYHDAILADVVRQLPPDTAFTESTVPEFFRQIGVDPPFARSAGPDLYVIDWQARTIRPFDITGEPGVPRHVSRVESYADILNSSLEGTGWTTVDTVPELPYMGMSQEEAAAAVISELSGYAYPH